MCVLRVSMRRMVRGVATGLALLAWLTHGAHAGAQREEALSDAVRTALSAAVAQQGPPELPQHDAAQKQAFLRWQAEMQPRLDKQLRRRTAAAERARRDKSPGSDSTTTSRDGRSADPVADADAPITHELATPQLQREFLQTVWYESRRAALEPALVLGLVQVESGFRKFAISSAGARGYMQVMPFWSRQLADGDAATLFHMQANLRYGCVILRHYLQLENGDLTLALGRYNGSRGQTAYPDAVLAARRQWQME